MSTRVNPHAVPSGGWQAPLGFNGAILRGYDFSDLQAQVRKDRQARGVPVGDVEADLNAYFCGRNPSDCHGGQTQAASYPAFSLLDRVNAWTNTLSNPDLVDALTAKERAGTPSASVGCIGCYNNTPLGCCGSKHPQGTTADKLLAARQGNDVERYGSELFACQALGWDNRTAVWLQKDGLHLPENLPTLPDRCWVPKEISPDGIKEPESPNHP